MWNYISPIIEAFYYTKKYSSLIILKDFFSLENAVLYNMFSKIPKQSS